MPTRESDNLPLNQLLRVRRRPRLGAEARHHRRRVVGYALLAGAVVLMVNALVGENGYLAGLRARRDYNVVMADLIRIRVENQQLKEQARRLKDDPSAIEDSARRELGLIRPGETLVIIRDGAKKDGQ
jgi:cell division protein FtsB